MARESGASRRRPFLVGCRHAGAAMTTPAETPRPVASTVDPAEVARFSKLSAEWWDPKGKMAPLHKINPLRLGYIRDAACRKFGRNPRSLACLDGLRVLDIGCGAGLLCEPLARLGAEVIGVDPSESNIAAARLHAEHTGVAIDYRCTTVEAIDPLERFDIVLAMEVVEHVTEIGTFVGHCTTLLKPTGLMVASTLNRTWKSFALAIVGAEYVLRWLPCGTHQWDRFVTPDELAHHLAANGLAVTDRTGVIYNPLADRWRTSARDLDVNYMVTAEAEN
jgi:2-polyprenyl-6-hydroxyphenyl methylase/3-demethylubiquinone-9 3-methyltransferase